MKLSLTLVAGAMALVSGAAMATPYGRVVSSTPVTAQVAVPMRSCQDRQQLVRPRTSGSGAVLGAVIGGAVGHALGDGFGRAAATGLGVVAGAALGDQAEAANLPPSEVTVRQCQNALRYENRVLGYDVVYEYQGQRYRTRLAQDPGDRIALQVDVAPAAAPMADLPITVEPAYAQPIYAPPAVIYAPAVGYVGYGGPVISVSPPVYYGGHSRHRHWR